MKEQVEKIKEEMAQLEAALAKGRKYSDNTIVGHKHLKTCVAYIDQLEKQVAELQIENDSLHIVKDEMRRRTIEECAKVAEARMDNTLDKTVRATAWAIRDAIRKLKQEGE